MRRFPKPNGIQILLLLAGLLAFLYIADVLIQRNKNIVLQIFVANDDQNVFDEKIIEQELGTYFHVAKDERIIVDDSLYVVFDSSDRYVESSLSKIYAYMAAKELDILIAPYDVVSHYTTGLPMLDLSTLFSEEPALMNRVLPYLVSLASTDGIEKQYLLDLTHSRYKGSNAQYLVIPASAPHCDAIIAFLDYLFPDK